MSALFLLPGLISLYLVVRGRVETAFLAVYLPALLLLPDGFGFHAPHLPAISAAQAALMPIGAVALKRLLRNGLPAPMDLLAILFFAGITLSEVTREKVMNDGILQAFEAFVSIFLPCVVGRTIIEPGLRLATVRRFVVLILCLGPLCLVEFRFAQNLYGMVGQRVFDLQTVQPYVQIRSGFGRVGASFSDSELAGIVFGITIALNTWLSRLRQWGSEVDFGRFFGRLMKYHIPALLLMIYLLLTQSRGPLIATAVALLILRIPGYKNKKIAGLVVVLLLGAGALAGIRFMARYTQVSRPGDVTSEQQGSAVYRSRMNLLYQPIAEKGGLLGWGTLSIPVLPGMASIDNEFLLVHLAWGELGFILLLLIVAETFRRLFLLLWKVRGREDQAFVFSMLAAMALFWIAIATVYMGEQVPQIAFLLIGWTQSIPSTIPTDLAAPKFQFARVFQ